MEILIVAENKLGFNTMLETDFLTNVDPGNLKYLIISNNQI